MKYYLDITLLPDAEANLGFLWQKVYQQIHIALVEQKTADNQSDIAVSMPEYGDNKFPLGTKLRLLSSSEEQLQWLDAKKWLSRLTDYTHCSAIKEVPSTVTQFARFKRKQFNSSSERLARRRVRRKGGTFEQAVAHFNGFAEQQTKLPFLHVKSLSGGRLFKLFIERELINQPIKSVGKFNCYGLSECHAGNQVAIPWF
jgi:CRISPR-associated endonuclease Csy4